MDDWYKLVQYVSNNYPSIKQAITTNGTMFETMKKNSNYEKIVNDGIDEVGVSLDYAEREKHDKLDL